MRLAVIAVLLVATPAGAQTTNTNCYTSYGQTYCRSTTQPAPPAIQYDPNAFQRGWNNSQQIFDSFERGRQLKIQREQQEREAFAAQHEQRARVAVGNMIAEGRCADAKQYALALGMLALAQEAQGLCEPPPE